MSDPVSVERPVSVRNAIYTMMGAMIIFGVTTIWYGGQLKASLESRLSALERQQSLSQVVIDKLNDAREEYRVHGAQVDGKLTEMDGKMNAILEIVQQDTAPPTQSGGIPNGGPENFQRPPKGRGQPSR